MLTISLWPIIKTMGPEGWSFCSLLIHKIVAMLHESTVKQCADRAKHALVANSTGSSLNTSANSPSVGSEILTVVIMKSTPFWDVSPCSLVEVY
jgi:hypothetical protein